MTLTEMFKKKEKLISGKLRVIAEFVHLAKYLQIDHLRVFREPVEDSADRNLVEELIQRREAKRKKHLEVDLPRRIERAGHHHQRAADLRGCSGRQDRTRVDHKGLYVGVVWVVFDPVLQEPVRQVVQVRPQTQH